MKRIALSVLVAAAVAGAADYNYEISPVVGYLWNSTSDETNTNNGGAMGGVDNHIVYGVEMQMNNVSDLIKPELSILYGRDRASGQTDKTGVLTTMVNGVYEVEGLSGITPFAKAGVGYEWYTDTHPNDYDGVLVDAGLGMKADLTKQLALKVEGLYMYKWNNNGVDGSNGEVHNVAALVGLTFSFDEKAGPVAAPAPEPKPKPEPKPEPVAAAPVDSDKDGVFDDMDKCPNTPAGFKVDADGCPVKATLHLNFAFDSSAVDEKGTAKVNEFSAFLKESPAYDAVIIGHADSTGTTQYNQKLSERRADKVKSLLIEQGIDENRLSTVGEGETMPIATNATKEGRAQNRRIEVDLRE
jgi:OOP family OmpA-OmpF porin